MSPSLLALALPITYAGVAHAASFTYDADTPNPGAQDGSGAGWNTTAGNTGFWDGAGNAAWPNTTADDITFGAGSGAAGAVTVGTVTANKITFGSPGSGNYSLTGGAITLGGTTPTIAANSDASIASVISGSAGLTKTGASQLILTGANNYTTGTTISSGTLQIGSGAVNGTYNGAYAVSSGATLRLNRNTAAALPWSSVTGAGTIAITGATSLDFQGFVTALPAGFNGTLQCEKGRCLTATPAGGGLGGTANIVVQSGAQLGMWNGGTFAQNFTIAGTGWGEAAQPGAIRLANAGATIVLNGSVTLSNNAGVIARGSSTNTFNGVISGAYNLTMGGTGPATYVFTNANTYGGTIINGNGANLSTLQIGNGGTTGSLGSGPVTNNGAIKFNRSDSFSVSNVISGTGSLTQAGSGTLTLTGANTYSGGTNIKNGTIALAGGNNDRLGTTGPLALGDTATSGKLVLGDASGASNQTVGGLSTTGLGGSVVGGNATTDSVLTVNVASGTNTFAGALGGPGANENKLALTKTGAGTLSLTGANTFTGPVSVTGALMADTLSLNNTTLTIHGFNPANSTPPLQVNTSFTTGGTVPVQIDGTFTAGSYPLIYYPSVGGIGGSGISALQLQTSSLPRGVTASLVNNIPNASVDLNVSSFSPLTWKGNTVGQVWDINTTTNWVIGATPEKYQQSDLVVFNDSATGSNTDVVLNVTVLPQSVTFDNDTKNYSLSGTGSIGGTAPITKSNNGTVKLLTSNTTTGTTTVSGGTLQLSDGSAYGNLTGPLVNNATVLFEPSATATYTGDLGGDNNGIFTKNGSGTQVLLSAAITSTGTFQVNQGTLQFGTGTTNGAMGSAQYALAAGGTLRMERTAAATPPWANITGAGRIELNAATSGDWGTLALPTGFTGLLQVEKGRVNANGGSAAPGNASKIEIRDGAQFLCFGSATPYNTPIEIAGAGWGETGYPGGLRLAGTATATWAGSVTLTADSGIMSQRAANFTITGAITGAHVCEFYAGDPVAENGVVTVAPTTPGQNTYAATKINGRPAGSVVAGGAQAFSSGPLTVDNAILKLNGNDLSFANLGGAGGAIGNYHATTPATLTVGSDNSSTSYAGTLRDGAAATLALIKTGTGTLMLTAASSYTGNTTVSQGTLALATASLADTSTVTIATGAKLELNTATADAIGSLVLGTTTLTSGTFSATHPVYGSYFAGTGSVVIGGAYDAWAASKGLDGSPGKEKGATDDPDKDGIQNLAEFYLDGNPLANDQVILPVATLDATYLTLTFKRRDDAEGDVLTQAIQYGSTLTNWTDVALGAVSSTSPAGVIVTVTENDTAPDTIIVQIPRTLATDGKLLSRLNLTRQGS